MKPAHLFIDQYGNKFWARTRKELKAQIPGNVSIQYCDMSKGPHAGKTMRTGYVIGQHWLTEYAPVLRETHV